MYFVFPRKLVEIGIERKTKSGSQVFFEGFVGRSENYILTHKQPELFLERDW